jgi:hypothetical protein
MERSDLWPSLATIAAAPSVIALAAALANEEQRSQAVASFDPTSACWVTVPPGAAN